MITSDELKKFKIKNIRNFAVIAHIDHGKSTLCDRILELTGTINTRSKNEQVLDKLQVEKERGITVKAQSASMVWSYNGEEYLLNLIDTPGHVDFSYEVSRSLRACQGVILLVDATQGVQAQTMANFYQAFNLNLTVIPVINKIDVASADVERVKKEIEKIFGFPENDCFLISGKTGLGVPELINGIIEKIPSLDETDSPYFKALLFDSWFNEYKGVICLIAITQGSIKKGDYVSFYQTGIKYEVLDVGIMHPDEQSTGFLYAGQVGYIITGMKTVKEAYIGDTLFIDREKASIIPFEGFKPPQSVVFAGIFPVDSQNFDYLRDAVEKLTLNDASVSVEKTQSIALGIGFKCGFLGLLHMEVFQQRLLQEYNISVIATTPTVLYKVMLRNKTQLIIETPSDFPDPSQIEYIEEPLVKATIISPHEHLGKIITLCQKKRGKQIDLTYLTEERIILIYEIPLNEIAIDFYDTLKSITSGYGSLDYEECGYHITQLVKMDILLNGKPVDVLSVIVHQDNAYTIGCQLVDKLKEIIERQMFEVVIQAAIGAKIISRATISAYRKDVIDKCYGGDITRKKKLLEKQKEGKKGGNC
jgi:elongation factor 4